MPSSIRAQHHNHTASFPSYRTLKPIKACRGEKSARVSQCLTWPFCWPRVRQSAIPHGIALCGGHQGSVVAYVVHAGVVSVCSAKLVDEHAFGST